MHTEKTFDKIQHPSMINILNKLEIKGNSSFDKAQQQKLTANIILNDKKF